MCYQDEAEAIRLGLDGFRLFGYSRGHDALFGEHRPGRADLWERSLQVKDRLSDNTVRGGITPTSCGHLSRYERAGFDQVMFIRQSGANRHEQICQSLEVIAQRVMPEFKDRKEVRKAEKRRELAPYIAAVQAEAGT